VYEKVDRVEKLGAIKSAFLQAATTTYN